LSDNGEGNGFSRLVKFTPSGLLKWLKLKITGRELIVAGECRMCGRCCRHLNLSYKDRWIRKESDFDQLVEKYPEYDRFHITGKTPAGLLIFRCDRVTDEGRCGDHAGRPDICRDYPEPDLPFSGGELLDHCGYYFKAVPSFKKQLDKAHKSPVGDPADAETGLEPAKPRN